MGLENSDWSPVKELKLGAHGCIMVASETLWFEDSKAYEDRLKDGGDDLKIASSQGQSYARGGKADPIPVRRALGP
ncbi:hypothetical protein E4U47_005814 [Claviceps purpurea]|nr:hypothetical protein E4U47_005814 [Claviceps purpurea]